MENERKWTVYIHKSPSGKYYIGITSLKPEHRWNNGEGYKTQKYFYRAITKYGWDNIEHIIFRKNLTAKEAKELEIKLIAYFKSNNQEYGYNITAGGDGTYGFSRFGEKNPMYGKHHSEEAKRKMGETRKGKYTGENNHYYGKHRSQETKKKISEAKKGKYAGENHPRAKPVICIETNKYYGTAKEAAEETNTNRGSLCGVLKGKRKTAGGYTWRYATEEEIKAKRSLARAVNEHAS